MSEDPRLKDMQIKAASFDRSLKFLAQEKRNIQTKIVTLETQYNVACKQSELADSAVKDRMRVSLDPKYTQSLKFINASDNTKLLKSQRDAQNKKDLLGRQLEDELNKLRINEQMYSEMETKKNQAEQYNRDVIAARLVAATRAAAPDQSSKIAKQQSMKYALTNEHQQQSGDVDLSAEFDGPS